MALINYILKPKPRHNETFKKMIKTPYFKEVSTIKGDGYNTFLLKIVGRVEYLPPQIKN